MRSWWQVPSLESSQDGELHQDEELDVAVIGAGLTGLVTALLLARGGRRVTVLEARQVGGGTTARSTAKVSALQGTHLSLVRRHHGADMAAAYVTAQCEGAGWLRRFCEDHGVPVEERTAVTFAGSMREVAAVEREHRAAAAAGLPVRLHDDLVGAQEVVWPVYRAVTLAEQAQVDPGLLLAELAREVQRHGGVLHEDVPVRSVGLPRRGDGVTVTLGSGVSVRAQQVVLATGTPILDRGLHFSRLTAQRSYVLVAELPDRPGPYEGMYLSAGNDSRSVRDVRPGDGRSLLMLGGAGHVTGRGPAESTRLDRLRSWLEDYYPEAVETHAWSAQDYASFDGLPVVGALPGGRVRVASGYQKWGFTNAVAAALATSAALLGGEAPAWARCLREPRVPGLRDVGSVLTLNAEVGASAVTGAARAAARLPERSPVCTHLGGVLRWNDAEQSWDCPLHGSRFGADGHVLDGPATRPLKHAAPTPSTDDR